jgi:hypothetical protein
MNGDGLDTEFATSTQYPQRDFATICNNNFI